MSFLRRAFIYVGVFLVNAILGAPKRAFGVIAPALAASLGVDRAAVGALFSLGLWARLPAVAFVSLLSDYSPRVILGIGTIIFSGACVGLMFSTSHYASMAIFLFLLYMGAMIAGYCSLAVVVKEKSMGTTIDTVPMSMAKNVAVLLFGSLAIVLLSKYGVGSVFLSLGTALFLCTFLFLVFTIGVKLELKPTMRPQYSVALKQKGIARFILFMIGFEGMYLGLATMGMFIMKGAYKAPMKELIGLYILALAVPALISRPLWGAFAKRWTPRLALGIAMWFQIVGLLTIVFVNPDPVTGILLFSFGSGAGTVCFLPYLADRYGRKRVGEMFGVIGIPIMTVTSFFPMLSGYLYKTSGLFPMIGLLCFIGLIGFMAFFSESKVVYEDQRNG